MVVEHTMASPAPSSTDTMTSTSTSNSVEELDITINTKCSLCTETYTIPKVLSCFHTFCQPCLEKMQEIPEKIQCPTCRQETLLPASGVVGLLPDYAVSNLLEANAEIGNALSCTGCKSKDTNAVARCFDCANFLCPNCVMAHQFMHCFEGHRVLTLGELQNKNDQEVNVEKSVTCSQHKNEIMKYFCKVCETPICKECTQGDHKGHEHDVTTEVGGKQVEMLRHLVDEAKVKANNLRGASKSVEHSSNRLQILFHKAQNEINDTYNFYLSMLEERKQECLKELDGVYNSKQVSLSAVTQKMQDSIEKLYQSAEFIEKLTKYASVTETLMFKRVLDSRIQSIINYNPDVSAQSMFDIEFVSNYQAIQVGVRNTFGYIRQTADLNMPPKPQPIARPNGVKMPRHPNGSLGLLPNGTGSLFEPNPLTKAFGSNSSLNSFCTTTSTTTTSSNGYEKWSSGGFEIMQNGGGSVVGSNGGVGDVFSTAASTTLPDPVMDLTSKLITASLYPPKISHIKRQKMIYHCKFGEFGVMEGQFTEPSGVAVNAQNDIIVADTNNHRIQIFDREGRFKFQFGECGKRDGQLLYPNRVSVVRSSGDIVVTERSPTHQVQIYNQYGQFVCKFGANILQHPRGVTVDNKGRIIIVECKVMRVIIFDQMGNVLHKFSCSKHLEFPNGVVVNDKEEIFISDNRAHCVKVFSYQGVFLRQIGGEGVTNYPIGVGINQAGEILIADNHNNFNLTIFTQEGQLINALESKVKHAQCFDVALMDDSSVVLASKDYRLYVYRYNNYQLPNIGM
ncbi:brain tumor protein [Lingula anatina]|uniref:Brain tumor protein n=1 Tax=Lingula anatina TaxID=7574 RepID=A0A1S3JML1_LINAN|nr:brain tumor protein [Lingula anatina]|eukprot:XP_013411612.1 brain tumor protein [Lingula anatina]